MSEQRKQEVTSLPYADQKAILREQFYFARSNGKGKHTNNISTDSSTTFLHLQEFLQKSALTPHSLRTSCSVDNNNWGHLETLNTNLASSLNNINCCGNLAKINNEPTVDEEDEFTNTLPCTRHLSSSQRITTNFSDNEEAQLQNERQHELHSSKHNHDLLNLSKTKALHQCKNPETSYHYYGLLHTTLRPVHNRYKQQTEKLKQADRYRRIEDLALYVNSGIVNNKTRYFIEPMQRRVTLLDERELSEQRGHETLCSGDPRNILHFTNDVCGVEKRASNDDNNSMRSVKQKHAKKDESESYSANGLIPRKTLETLRVFNSTAGLVKPYAISKSVHFDKHYLDENIPFTATNCMEAYVTSMRSQRPTKGLHATYETIQIQLELA